MKYRFLFLFLIVCMVGCTHPLEIVGNGDILSTSGERDCLLENQPCDIVALNDYIETYMPSARPGYEFVGWEGCSTQSGDDCSFDVPASLVNQFWFQTVSPLRAQFAPLCSDAPTHSFEAIQTVIFDGIGCSTGGCHSGGNPAGGMNLSGGNAYANIVNVKQQFGNLNLVLPGNATNSYLYHKVAAKTNPGSFTITGNPMPVIGSALTSSQLAALASWINDGAPQFGRSSPLNEVEQLLGLCD